MSRDARAQDIKEDVKQNQFKVKFAIPEYVQTVARILLKEGFKCYLVGGALRDVVMNIEPDDYDLATDAHPEQMLKIFPKAVSTGIKFGTVTVIIRESQGDSHDVQVTTFRSEEKYVGGRWPSEVKFVTDLDEDLSRRDFTFNAMAFDFGSGELDGLENLREWSVYDPFGGRNDLEKKLVRAVGDPVERFQEDGLRAFKACRMAAQLGFEIEPKTFKAISETLAVAAQVSMERIRDEFMKMLKNSEKPSIGLELMRKSGLMELFIPELLEGLEVEQNKYHTYDVYVHLLRTLDIAPVHIRLSALLHDIAKPRKAMPNGHFYGHDIEGEKMTRIIMKRMKFSKAETERVANLVRHHMFYYPVVDDGSDNSEVEKYEAVQWTDAAVRRFVARVGEENIDDLFALRIADASSNPAAAFKPKEIEMLQVRISEIRQQDMALKVSDLKINGNDLMRLGVEKGPKIGEVLGKLLTMVIDDPGLNTHDTLEKLVKEML
ncbi:MAG: HD domain-containing protein [Patescibacteria group bacterium]|nr:HD domain-containing protein [Patescibacteria group bacterium]